MKLQTNLFSSDCCENRSLYAHTQGEVTLSDESARLAPGAVLETDAYMNLFDASFWLAHSTVRKWRLEISAAGQAKVELLCRLSGQSSVCDSVEIDCREPGQYALRAPTDQRGQFFLRMTAQEETALISAAFVTDELPRKEEIRLGAAICTYHRADRITRNLKRFQCSRFFDEADELYGKLQIHVADNGEELPEAPCPFIRIFHNPNTGGSGGFTRALREFRARQEKLALSHVIFMDDDVDFLMESFYRLHAFLSYRDKGASDAVIAGRMFRTDRRQVQYTAAEIWNGGDLRHIGFNCDMTEPGNLEAMNDSAGAEYGGWWFCCFPMDFAMKNDPMPFFLHCDDVEYGLRHGGTPLLLNGIQVWHETSEYRQSPLIRYYDTRNPMFVNERYAPDRVAPQALYQAWFDSITKLHVEKDYCGEYMLIAAMRDYLKGPGFLARSGARRHRQLSEKRHYSRYENMIFWRLTALCFILTRARNS